MLFKFVHRILLFFSRKPLSGCESSSRRVITNVHSIDAMRTKKKIIYVYTKTRENSIASYALFVVRHFILEYNSTLRGRFVHAWTRDAIFHRESIIAPYVIVRQRGTSLRMLIGPSGRFAISELASAQAPSPNQFLNVSHPITAGASMTTCRAIVYG